MTTPRVTSPGARIWRTGLLLVLVVGACDRRQLSLFDQPGVRDAGTDVAGDGDDNGDGERSRRCDTRSDCTEERPFCEDERCVQCLAPGDCDPGYSCRFEDHFCVPTCYDKSDCSGGGRPICAVTAGVCVECARQLDCEGHEQEPFCELRTGRCVECLNSEDCDWLCHPESHECVECVYDDDCEDAEECVRGVCER